MSCVQGDLDGLCGFYSIVNAIDCLTGLSHTQRKDLFVTLLQSFKSISKSRDPILHAMSYGITMNQLLALVRVAQEWVKPSHSIEYSRFDCPARVDSLFKAISDTLSDSQCVFIVGINGKCDHWTVVYEASERQLRLLDSGSLRVLNRANAYVSRTVSQTPKKTTCLHPSEVILIKSRGS